MIIKYVKGNETISNKHQISSNTLNLKINDGYFCIFIVTLIIVLP